MVARIGALLRLQLQLFRSFGYEQEVLPARPEVERAGPNGILEFCNQFGQPEVFREAIALKYPRTTTNRSVCSPFHRRRRTHS